MKKEQKSLKFGLKKLKYIAVAVILIAIAMILLFFLLSQHKTTICDLEKNPEDYLKQNFTFDGRVVHTFFVLEILKGFTIESEGCRLVVTSNRAVKINQTVTVSGMFGKGSPMGYYLSTNESIF